jgi:predicted nucleic acid-binding protein
VIGVLDTHVVVRYLTNDSPDLAARAARVIDSGQLLLVPAIALVETSFVLRSSTYLLPREVVIDTLVEFVRRATIRVDDLSREVLVEALLLCRPSRRVSIVDALLWALARSRAVPLVSFGRRLPPAPVAILDDWPGTSNASHHRL